VASRWIMSASSRAILGRWPPEGHINLVHHLAHGVQWQECFLRHANNAVSLEEVVVFVDEPAVTATRLSRLAGCVVALDPEGALRSTSRLVAAAGTQC
jgi:hypothetical protein